MFMALLSAGFLSHCHFGGVCAVHCFRASSRKRQGQSTSYRLQNKPSSVTRFLKLNP
jgi:hypothetical protein